VSPPGQAAALRRKRGVPCKSPPQFFAYHTVNRGPLDQLYHRDLTWLRHCDFKNELPAYRHGQLIDIRDRGRKGARASDNADAGGKGSNTMRYQIAQSLKVGLIASAFAA
jgi:hypothetical protein